MFTDTDGLLFSGSVIAGGLEHCFQCRIIKILFEIVVQGTVDGSPASNHAKVGDIIR